ADERACGRDDARAGGDAVDGEDRDEALARAGRQHDRAAAAGREPALERRALVVARLARVEQRRVQPVGPGAVLGDAALRGPCAQLGQPVPGRDECAGARVVRGAGRRLADVADDGEAVAVGERGGSPGLRAGCAGAGQVVGLVGHARWYPADGGPVRRGSRTTCAVQRRADAGVTLPPGLGILLRGEVLRPAASRYHTGTTPPGECDARSSIEEAWSAGAGLHGPRSQSVPKCGMAESVILHRMPVQRNLDAIQGSISGTPSLEPPRLPYAVDLYRNPLNRGARRDFAYSSSSSV